MMLRERGFIAVTLFLVTLTAQASAPARPAPPTAQFKVKEVTLPFEGRFFVPDDGNVHPGVLYLHGSEGGIDFLLEAVAKDMASRGYATLALCWFGCGSGSSRPAKLEEVDLGFTYDSWTWLKNSEFVKGQRTALYGISRGAEQALLLMDYLAAKFPELARPDAVALHAPFDQILPPFSGNFQTGFAYQWRGSHDALASGTVIPIATLGRPVSVSHGLIDGLSPFMQSYHFQDELVAAGVAFSRDTQMVAGSDCKNTAPGPERPNLQADGRVEFHHFQCEMHIFSSAAEAVRMSLLEAFLKKAL